MRAATSYGELVRVWDRFVRFFHWSLVALIAAAWLTEDLKAIHHWIGYTVLALVAARLVWGMIGTSPVGCSLLGQAGTEINPGRPACSTGPTFSRLQPSLRPGSPTTSRSNGRRRVRAVSTPS